MSERDGNKVTTTGFLELRQECRPMSDHIGLCDDDGMPFCLTSLLPLVGRGVKLTIEYDEATDAHGREGDHGNEPLIYQSIGITPSGYAAERQRMRDKAKHHFRENPMKLGITGNPMTPECFVCSLDREHGIHDVKEPTKV